MAAAMAASNSTELKCKNCIKSYQLKGSSGRRPPLLPLLLTCGHTFCSQCIPKFSPPSTSSIRCPLCQAVAPYNPKVDSAKQIPPNLHLVGLLYCKQHSLPSVASESAAGKVILDPELWTKLTPVPPSPGALDDMTKPCEECRKLTRHKCRQCGVPLCKECFRLTHSAAVFLRKHELIAVLSSTFSTCPVHELPMDRFCSSDRVTFCSECATNHKGHEVALIVEKGGELHDRLKPLLESARKVLRSMKRSHATVSDEGLASLKEQLFQLMDKVEQQFILLHTALQARCLQLMNSLALAAETQATDLQAICHKLKDGIDRLTDTMTYIQEVSEDSSQLVQCGDRILAELNILLELPCSLHRAEKEPLRCNLDDSVHETFKDYGTVVPPENAWYAIGNVIVDSDNDTPRSMSEAEDNVNDKAEPDSNMMDGVREGVDASGSEDDEAESSEGEKIEGEGSEGLGATTMDTSLAPSHSIMETTLREESGGEGDDSAEDDPMMAADTSVSREALKEVNLPGSPFLHTQCQDGGLRFLPQSHEERSPFSPLSTSLMQSHPPQGGNGVKQSSPGGAVLKGSTVEKSLLKGVPGPSGSSLSTSVPPQNGAEGGVGREGLEVGAKEDEHTQVHQKGGNDDSLVRVVHVDNPGKFFVRYNREVSQFDRMMARLNSEQRDKVRIRAKEISVGTLCASSYSGGEGRLYRAEVSSLPTKVFPFYTVKYIDLGDTESVKLERLCHLPPNMATILPLAHCCKLAHIGPIQMAGKYPEVNMPAVWGERATLNFKAQLIGKELKVEVVSCESDCLAVDLYLLMVTEWVSVAERLVNKGLAQREEKAGGEIEEEDDNGKEEEEEERFLCMQEIPLGETLLDCVVCEAGSPNNFFIQGNNVSQLQDLMDQLQQEALISQRVARPTTGVLCMGLFTDGQWYRASIEDVCDGRDGVTVRYVDFGNVERVPLDHLKQINSSLLNLPAQAIPCALTSVVPMGGDGAGWSQEACRVFSSLLTNKRVQAEVVEEGGGAGGVLQLNITDPPIADNLVADKLAMYSGPVVFPPPTLPQSGDVCRGFVVHVDTPALFHVRKYDPVSDQTLESLLQQVSPPPSSHALTWSSGDCCCTHFCQDTNWHRAVVTQRTQNEAEYEVYYVDYGNTAVVKAEDMVPVLHPELLAIPQQALCCRLANVTPLEEAWSTGACVFLSTAVMNQLVVLEIKDVDLRESAPLSVEISLLFSEAFSSGPMKLSDSLIDNGYALSSNALHLQLYDGPSYRPHPLPDDNPFTMMVICVQNDGQVVGQLEENQAELEALMEKVQAVCRKNKSWLGSLAELKRGQPCCAKFSEDNLWYRAVVDSIVNGRAIVRVCYIDFGNCEEVPLNCIVPKPVCMDVPTKSICLQVAQTESLTWNESIAQALTEIVFDKQCVVHLKEPFEVAGSAYGLLQLNSGEDVLQLLMDQLQK